MKLTKDTLKQIIKEELEELMTTDEESIEEAVPAIGGPDYLKQVLRSGRILKSMIEQGINNPASIKFSEMRSTVEELLAAATLLEDSLRTQKK
jgi:hypothetical protein